MIGADPRMPLDEAVRRWVRSGMSLHVAFNGARPNSLMRELARQFRGTDPRFAISSSGMGGSLLGLPLMAAGICARVSTGFVGEAYPSPRPSPFVRKGLRAGQLEIEEWSMLTLANERMRC